MVKLHVMALQKNMFSSFPTLDFLLRSILQTFYEANINVFDAFEKDKTNPNNQKYEGPCSRLTEFTRNKNVRIKKIQAKRLLQNFGSFQQKCCQNS